MVKFNQMEPKPIQDVAPPKSQAAPPVPKPMAEPMAGPEVVNNIPVHAPTAPAPQAANPDKSFIVSEAANQTKTNNLPQPPAASYNAQKAIPKVKTRPTAVIFIATLAVICIAAGAYLKFFRQ